MDATKTVKICSFNNKPEAEMIIDILKQNQIPAYREGIGSADIMNLYAGNSRCGEDIYVNEKDADNAKRLIENYIHEDGKAELVHRSKVGQIFSILILLAFIILIIYIFYISI